MVTCCGDAALSRGGEASGEYEIVVAARPALIVASVHQRTAL